MTHMPRRPEPELMDDADQARAYSEADFTSAHDGFVALAKEHLGAIDAGRAVLDLGCGPADVTVRFARAYEGVLVDGIDGAEQMLALGRARITSHGLADRVQLAHGYVPGCALPRTSYDVVISNSLLHHLNDPLALWSTVKRAARAGAPIFVMDLMRPESEHDAQALVDAYADGEPKVLRDDFYASLLAAYTPDEVRAQLSTAGLDALSVTTVTDRHFIVTGRAP